MKKKITLNFRLLFVLLLFIGTISSAYSQKVKNVEIKGVVLDEQGETLPGAHVLILNKNNRWGAQTGMDGDFSIKVPEDVFEKEKLDLTVTFLGYTKYSIPLKKNKTEYKIRMSLDNAQLEEVLVTGYQQVDRRKTASSISSVVMDEVLTPAMTTIDQALEGRIPDLMYLQNSGDVGATARLRVRGTSTLIGSREPLWVLDGFVLQDPVDVTPDQLNDPDFVNYIGNAIQGLNPQDIERIDVLKDAAATAVYGTKASNGVIVITTKKGKVGPPRISYSNQSKIVIRPRYSDRAVNLMSSRERMIFGQDLVDSHYSFPRIMPHVGYEGAYYRYQTKQTSYEDFLKEIKYYENINTDWFDILTRNAFTNAHTLSLSGGNEKTRYYASLGYTSEKGVKKTEYVDRYTTSVNFNTQISKSLKFNMRLNGNVQKKNHSPRGVNPLDYAYNTTRALPLYNEDGSLFFYKNKVYPAIQGKDHNKYNYNILNEINNSSSEYSGNSVSSAMELTYNIKNIVDLSASFSYSRNSTNQAMWFGEKTNYVAALKNGEFGEKPLLGDAGYSELPYGGVLETTNTVAESFTGRFSSYFRYIISTDKHKHLFTSNLGLDISSANSNSIEDKTRGYFKERGMQYLNMASDELDKFPYYKKWLVQPNRRINKGLSNSVHSWFTIAYDLDNYFTISANTGFDTSNKFGNRSNERFLPLWSTAIRLNLKDLFLKRYKKINELTIRSSYGTTGYMLDGETPNLQLNQGSFNSYYGENVSTVHKLPNPNLKWEVTTNTNFAVSLSAFDHRLSANAEVWTKYTKDAFATINVSPINGISTYNINNGDISNFGYNFTISGYPIKTKDWRLYLSTSYSWVSNTVKTKTSELYNLDNYLNGTAIVDGRPIGTFYSYEFLGLNPLNGVPVFDDYEDRPHLLKEKPISEVVKLIMKETGNREPKLHGSFYTTLTWKQLSLSMSFNYSVGSKLRLFPIYKPILDGIRADNNVRKELLDRWRSPGDENHTVVPALLSMSDPDFNKYRYHWSKGLAVIKMPQIAESVWQMYDLSDLRVVSGDYLRLSSLTLSYMLTQRHLKKTPFNSLKLSFNATNVFTLASKDLKGQDPSQANNQKAVLSLRPSYTLGLNVSF